ncbi:MAG TPA: hypothetical protein VJT49_34855 [Amycolatopsis sp.]|nr:hypothetical protein [Amycolatopsis sp.]HJQ48796.1 hypothetical protein [Amycolatopsis sp.]HKS50202.1 hypothetical protein [Amycolatopsis sp.]
MSSTDVCGFPDQGKLDETAPRTRRGRDYADAEIAGHREEQQLSARLMGR